MLDTVAVAAVVSGVITVVGNVYAVRRNERWTKKRDIARDRREAYERYLIAQQALRDDIEADKKCREAENKRRHLAKGGGATPKDHPGARAPDASRQDGSGSWAQTKAWRESGAAEMNARLVASDNVLDAISAFEDFAIAYTKAFKPGADPADWERELPGNWERERGKLIRAMRDEVSGTPASVDPGRVRLPIQTARLTLRPYEDKDVAAMHYLLYGDAEVRKYTGGVSTEDETRKYIQRYIEGQRSNGHAYWAVTERHSGKLIGEAGLKPLNDEGPEVELGYAFGKAYWGCGYAMEAASAVLDAAFGDLGLERVIATVDPANTGSRKVLEELGFSSAGCNDGTRLLCFGLGQRLREPPRGWRKTVAWLRRGARMTRS